MKSSVQPTQRTAMSTGKFRHKPTSTASRAARSFLKCTTRPVPCNFASVRPAQKMRSSGLPPRALFSFPAYTADSHSAVASRNTLRRTLAAQRNFITGGCCWSDISRYSCTSFSAIYRYQRAAKANVIGHRPELNCSAYRSHYVCITERCVPEASPNESGIV